MNGFTVRESGYRMRLAPSIASSLKGSIKIKMGVNWEWYYFLAVVLFGIWVSLP